jgi:bacterioferritin (cytochrome b1)
MNAFEQLYESERSIPTAEASAYFIGLKYGLMRKQAEWTEPPDESGVLEGQFAVPVEQVIAKLQQVIAAKFRLMIGYRTYAQSIRDHAWRAFKIEFYEHSEDELEGAEFYIKRSTALGGPVHIDAIEPPPASTKPIDILHTMIRAEQEGIQAQRELRQLVGDENPMKIGIEEHLLKDQHHLDELWQMIPEEESTGSAVLGPGASMAGDVAGGPPAAGAPPVEELGGESDGASAGATAVPLEEEAPDTEAAPEKPEPKKDDKAKEDKKKVASIRFRRTLLKMALDNAGGGAAMEGAEMTPPSADTSPGAPPPSPAASTSQQQMPINYLEAEVAGQQAQQQNEASFYRERNQQASQDNQMLQQQMQSMQTSLAQLQEQAAQSGAQIEQATMEASTARDEALAQTQQAAQMRMGVQRMRQAMMELASQEPEAYAPGVSTQLAPGSGDSVAAAGQAEAEQAAAMGMPPDAQTGAPTQQEGSGQEGPAGEAPAAGGGTPPGSPPAGAGAGGGGSNGPEQSASGESGSTVAGKPGAKPSVQLKVGSAPGGRAPWALAGGAAGALKGALDLKKKGPPEEGGTFARILQIAKTVGAPALMGAGAGAALGPEVGKLKNNLAALK